MVGNMSDDDAHMLRDLLNITMVTNAANQHNNPDQSAAWARMTAMSDNGDSVTSQVRSHES